VTSIEVLDDAIGAVRGFRVKTDLVRIGADGRTRTADRPR
jgi:hypothetical protein